MGVIRNTKSVKTLLDLFTQTNEAMSAVDLVGKLHGQMNKTTVYRILEKLKDDGFVHSFIGKDGNKWYAKYDKQRSKTLEHGHLHFQCRDCGRTECLTIDFKIPTIANHKVDRAELLLIGLCDHCSL